MPGQPSLAAELQQAPWRASGADYVVVGRRVADGTQSAADVEIVNLLTNQRLTSGTGQRIVAATPRRLAHLIADLVHEKVLGVRGAFATRLAYISVDGTPPSQRYQLIVADADGANARIVLESRQPIMSPSWSPDGEWLAYVSFEGRVSGIFVQRLRIGINGAPSWSPDGQKLALTLSGSAGNLDLYVLDLATQQLTRVTDDPGIDTEATWSPDGKNIYFTSDRGGGPQVYRLAVGSGVTPQRITFGSRYNSRPRLSPDGKQMAFVTLDSGGYRIALQDLASGSVRVLSRGRNDESPSFAPNGAALIFAGRERSTGTLTVISTDGLASQRLQADQGEVREPAWGPFLP
jgi:TolB protein